MMAWQQTAKILALVVLLTVGETTAVWGKDPVRTDSSKFGKTTRVVDFAVSRAQGKLNDIETDIARLLEAEATGTPTKVTKAQINYRTIIRHLYAESLRANGELKALLVEKADVLNQSLTTFDTLVTDEPQWEIIAAGQGLGEQQSKLRMQMNGLLEALADLDKATAKVNREIKDSADLQKYLNEMLGGLEPFLTIDLQGAPLPNPWPVAKGGADNAGNREEDIPGIEATLNRLPEMNLPPKFGQIAKGALLRLQEEMGGAATRGEASQVYHTMFNALTMGETLNANKYLTPAVQNRLLSQCQRGFVLLADARMRSTAEARLNELAFASELLVRLDHSMLEAGQKVMVGNLLDRSLSRLDQPQTHAAAQADLEKIQTFLTALEQYAKIRNQPVASAREDWKRLRNVGDLAINAVVDGMGKRLEELAAAEPEEVATALEGFPPPASPTSSTASSTAAPKGNPKTRDEGRRDDLKKPDSLKESLKKLSLNEGIQKLNSVVAGMNRIAEIPDLLKAGLAFNPKPEKGLPNRMARWSKGLADAAEMNGSEAEVVRDMNEVKSALTLLTNIKEQLPDEPNEETLNRLSGGRYAKFMEKFRDNERKLINSLASPGSVGLSSSTSNGPASELQAAYTLLLASKKFAYLSQNYDNVRHLNEWGAWQVDGEALNLLMEQAELTLTGEFQASLGGTTAFGTPGTEMNMLTYPQASAAVLVLARMVETVEPKLPKHASWSGYYLQAKLPATRQAFWGGQVQELALVCLDLNEAAYNKAKEVDNEAQTLLQRGAELLGRMK